MKSSLTVPTQDPTPIFEHFRGSHATELLTAAVAHFGLFERFAGGKMDRDALRLDLELEERPFVVLTTALKAMGLLVERDGSLDLTALSREHLLPGGVFFVGDYVKLAGESPSVLEMVERLTTNRPAGSEPDEGGAAYIFRDDIESAMEDEATARFLTLALAGRARNCAPLLAERLRFDGRRLLLDVGGGSGIYAIALLEKNPELRAIVWERPEVLKIAAENAAEYGVAERLECRAGDMFADPIPEGADTVLLSNVLHDWDVPQCRDLVQRCAAALPVGGELFIHDVYLNDTLDGPLPIALYSASLFRLTEGRAYSAGEYREWMQEAGLVPGEIVDTLVHCGVLPSRKR
jgi:predicted O-methyltransferase YrrM